MKRIATISPVFGCGVEDLRALAAMVEDSGFEAIFSPEVPPYSALANAQVFAASTSRIKVGTWIANIYMRNPIVTAADALTIQEISGGRMVLGIGVSHKPNNDKFGVDMGDPLEAMRSYVTELRPYLDGSSDKLMLKRDLPPVPVYIAALTEKTCELAGEVADGVMTYMATPDYMAKVAAAVRKGAQTKERFIGEIDITNGIPTFISDDLELAYKAARKGVAPYARLPFYQRMISNIGFPEITEKIRGGAKPGEAVTDDLLDAMALIGPASRCSERLEAFREAGLRLPIIVPSPVGKQSTLEVMKNVIDTFNE